MLASLSCFPSLSQPCSPFGMYLHSLVMHSESSRQAAPMGLRETPLQNGVILRSLIFEALSSDAGEPWTCKAKAFTLRHGTTGTLLCTLKEYCPLECCCLRQSKSHSSGLSLVCKSTSLHAYVPIHECPYLVQEQ